MQSNERQQHRGSVLRVLQSKDETRAFYDKISGVYDILADPWRQAPQLVFSDRSIGILACEFLCFLHPTTCGPARQNARRYSAATIVTLESR
jgi:hypothetical protein